MSEPIILSFVDTAALQTACGAFLRAAADVLSAAEPHLPVSTKATRDVALTINGRVAIEALVNRSRVTHVALTLVDCDGRRTQLCKIAATKPVLPPSTSATPTGSAG